MSFSIRDVLKIDLPTVRIVDVGAMAEGADRYARLTQGGFAEVIGFEPDRAQHAKLQNYNKPSHRYIDKFIGDGNERTFYITRYPGCSSLFRPDPNIINQFVYIGTEPGGNFTVVREEKVQTHRLDDIADCPPADFLKMDVQGAELDVLRGAEKSIANAVVIESEVEFLPLYENQPLFSEIEMFLRSRGFLFHKFLDIAGRGIRPVALSRDPTQPISQVLWADAIFVKDFTRLEAWTDDQLIKAAIVLHEAYFSYDLAVRLLLEFDTRRGTTHAEIYKSAMSSSQQLPLMYMNIKRSV